MRSTGHRAAAPVPADAAPDDPTIAAAMINIVRTLLAEVEGTVGVICPPSTKDELATQLEQARLAGADRVAVVTPLESKGLEYDGVLVVDSGRHRGRVARRRPSPLRRPHPADPAAGHARRRTWCKLA